MQGVRYLPGNFYRVDHIGGANGSLWQPVNNGGTCNGGRVYSVSLPEASSLDQYLSCNKEFVRQTMLKQETIFRAQVHELHRLYKRQRELMDGIRGREQSIDHLPKQSSQPRYFSSNMLPDMSQNPLQMPCWLLVNPKESIPSMLGQGNFRKPLDSVSDKSSYRDSVIRLEENYLREDRASSSKRHDCGKTILDLELPAKAYGEEEVFLEQNSVEAPQILLDPYRRILASPNTGLKLKKGSSSNANSSVGKINFLLDLNESPQLDESETSKHDSFAELHSTIMGHTHQDLYGKSKSVSPLPDEDIWYDVREAEGTDVLNNCSLPCFAFSSLFPFPDEPKTEASTSVASRKTLLQNSLGTSAVIQALPCFNKSECLNGSSRSFPMNSEFKRRLEPEGPSSMGSATTCINENGNCESITEHHSMKRCVENPSAAVSSKEMDLNVTPDSCLTETALSREYISSIEGPNMFDDPMGKLNKLKCQPNCDRKVVECPNFPGNSDSSQLSALASNSVHVKSSEDEDVLNCSKPGVSCSSHSSGELEIYSKKDLTVVNGTDEELPVTKNSCTKEPSIGEHCLQIQEPQVEVGSNSFVPVSPDGKGHSPLSGKPENKLKEIPLQLFEQTRECPDEEIDKVSAETIIMISKSGVQHHQKTNTSEPLQTSSDCLDWFADIVCFATSDPEHKLKSLVNKASNYNVVVPGGIEQSKHMKMKSTGSKVDNRLSATKHRRNKRTAGSMVVQRENAVAKKARQIKRFQSEGLKHVDSLSSCDMYEDFQTRNVAGGRNFDRNCHVKRSSRSTTACYPNGRMRKTCSGANHLTNKNELGFLLSYLDRWGKKSRRRKSRRARPDKLPWCWHNLVTC